MTAADYQSPRLSRRRFLRVAAVHAASMVAGTAALSRERRNPLPFRAHAWRGIALGSEVSIELFSNDGRAAQHALEACRREMLRLEAVFSIYDARSSVGRLNAFGRLDDPPRELVRLISVAENFSRATNGAFDVTVQPLIELLAASGGSCSEDEVFEARTLVDHRNLICAGNCVRLARSGMKVTFNGLAQGYITDRVAEILSEREFVHCLVDIGEKRALGPHVEGRPWRIGVEVPTRDALAGLVELNGRALATSGGYGRVFEGGDWHHLLDAARGVSRHDFDSVSVIADTATEADGISTCLAVVAPEGMDHLLEEYPSARVMVVPRGGDTLVPLTIPGSVAPPGRDFRFRGRPG